MDKSGLIECLPIICSDRMIGVLGGTFDPVHFGHLRTAVEVMDGLSLEEIRLVPCRHPPHRPATEVSSEVRLRMLQLAVAGETGLVIDSRELQRDGPSFTVDTLESIREELGAKPLGLIIGTDAFFGLPTWHRWPELFELAHIIVMHRAGYEPKIPSELADHQQRRLVHQPELLSSAVSGYLYFQQVIQLDISATRIRELIKQGKSPRYLLPDNVLDSIHENWLYR